MEFEVVDEVSVGWVVSVVGLDVGSVCVVPPMTSGRRRASPA